jgi:hypothetical protein
MCLMRDWYSVLIGTIEYSVTSKDIISFRAINAQMMIGTRYSILKEYQDLSTNVCYTLKDVCKSLIYRGDMILYRVALMTGGWWIPHKNPVLCLNG